MKLYEIFRYGLIKRFKRGVRLSIALTFKCNLKCPYCVVEMPTGELPKAKPSSLDELQHFIDSFPYRIREIKLTGGSPELHPDFVEFANWLLDKGIFVMIFTNLTHINKLKQLKRTCRLMFISTYHHCDSIKRYENNYNYLKQFYRINVEEIDDYEYFQSWHNSAKQRFFEINNPFNPSVKLLSYSKLKKLIGNHEMQTNKAMLRIAPDLQIFSTCYNVYVNKNK